MLNSIYFAKWNRIDLSQMSKLVTSNIFCITHNICNLKLNHYRETCVSVMLIKHENPLLALRPYPKFT